MNWLILYNIIFSNLFIVEAVRAKAELIFNQHSILIVQIVKLFDRD